MFTGTLRHRFAAIAPHVAPPAAVLDLGCVNARPARRRGAASTREPDLLFRRFVQANPDTLGVDVDPEGVAALATAGYRAVYADVHTLDLGLPFDVIVAGELLEHLENPGQFLCRARRNLRPAGRLILTTLNPFYALQSWKIWRHGWPRCNEGDVAWFDPLALCALLRRSGLAPVEGYWIQPHQPWLKAWKRLLRRYFRHSFLIVAEVST